jgi:hypothetical protein
LLLSTLAGDAFWKEFDFVVAGVATCLLANFAAVYLAAPTLGGAVAASGGGTALARFLAACPDNAFQTVLAGSPPFSIIQAPPPLCPSLPRAGRAAGVGLQGAVRGCA